MQHWGHARQDDTSRLSIFKLAEVATSKSQLKVGIDLYKKQKMTVREFESQLRDKFGRRASKSSYEAWRSLMHHLDKFAEVCERNDIDFTQLDREQKNDMGKKLRKMQVTLLKNEENRCGR